MRKALLFALTILLCLPLWGCGGTEKQDTAEVQDKFQAIRAAQAEVSLTCHYGDEVRSYTLLCSYTPEQSSVSVTAPEDLAGVAASFADGRMTLAYQDVLLDAGTYSATELSPLWAVPSLLDAVGRGYPLEVCREDVGEMQCLRATFEVTDSGGGKIYYAVWFDENDTPVRGEITVENVMVYAMEFSQFTTEEPEDGTDAAEDLGGD